MSAIHFRESLPGKGKEGAGGVLITDPYSSLNWGAP
jgi:hypothetical protein